ncbi:splicing factor ESS-2 homolog isoform X1 [Cimex lectularius]|uniref:Uncharacterized protein n=1 Tax=Cimex lectularius TaxID=79782 RepID=A0A8I6S980_CIMLE|nr:splicing factor ESS-2 homolog isoform X1 [Cimex lectularius]
MSKNNNIVDKAKEIVAKVDDVVFKQPKIPDRVFKKRKHKVLDEETYLEEMGKIIQRDFFPDLEKVKAQNEYLDALNKNDIIKLREIHAKYTPGSRVNTERVFSPATFETPIDTRPREDDVMSTAGNETKRDESGSQQSKENMSLDHYLASHTSEDNQSFEDIIEEAERNHRKKYSWLYKEDGIDKNEQNKALALPSIEQQADGIPRKMLLDSWTYKDKNYIMYVPDGVDLTPEEKIEMAKRKQAISHSNTRFKSNPFDEAENQERIQDLAHNQAKVLDGKIGVDGKELVSETPKVNGFSFVKTPSPAPGVSESPFMTWGEIEGTPFRLDGGDTPLRSTPGPSYFLPEPPNREKIALRLADKVNERHRDKKKKAIEAARRQLSSPLNRPGSLDRLQMLSPAAKKFATTHISRMGSDKSLSSFYSPVHRPATGSITPKTPKIGTPISQAPATITTDNLLNLNVKRRPRASDFFK